MDDRRLKNRLRIEADKIMPDVLGNIYKEVGLEPEHVKPKPKWQWPFSKIGTFSMGITILVIGVLLVPTFINGFIVASGETSIRLKIIPAEEPIPEPAVMPTIKYQEADEDTPVFSFRLDRYGKTVALDANANNALHAENDASKIIAGGLGLENTLRQKAVDLTLELVRYARRAGYIKSYAVGNYVAYRISGPDETYNVRLRANLKAELETYFRAQLIYGAAYEDETLAPANFEGYADFSSQIGQYRQDYDSRCSQHEHDDDRRGSGWGSDISEWMDSHGNHHMDSETSSSSDTGTGSQGTSNMPPTSTPDTGNQEGNDCPC